MSRVVVLSLIALSLVGCGSKTSIDVFDQAGREGTVRCEVVVGDDIATTQSPDDDPL